MKLFIDSCKIEEIKKVIESGIVSGITMNPSMVASLKTDYVKKLKEICKMVEIPIFAQVTSSKAKDIEEEGKALASIDDKIIVKVHFSAEGIKGMKSLKAEGIKVCATAVHSVIEAIIAGEVGADHVAIFTGALTKLSEINTDEMLSKVCKIYSSYNKKTKIMAAGVQNNQQLVAAANAGVDEITCTLDVWDQFFTNPYTLNRWNSFITDWKNEYGLRNWITGY